MGLIIENDSDTDRFTLTIFKKESPRIVIGEDANIVMSDSYIENQPLIPHDTIGFIPPSNSVSYVYRGRIEDDVRAFLRSGGTGVIVGLHAPGGLGKTELAKHAAEDLKDQFEGVLWIDVGEKVASQVVTDMLSRCGIQMPRNSTYGQQKNELHHYLSSHKLLVVFDDVRVNALKDINDFLPPKPSSALVTSRIQQIGSINKTFMLDHMTAEQAMGLLEAVLGEDVVHAEMESASRLVERCAWNPLAIEIAARRIRQFQGIKEPISRYLKMAKARFSELRMEGDSRWNMEYVFDLSYEDLSSEDKNKFCALAVFDATGFTPEAAAFIWGNNLDQTISVLSRFINLSLVKPVSGITERFRLHDLLDEYASNKLRESNGDIPARNALVEWLIDLFNEHYTDDLSTAPEVELELGNLVKSVTG